MPGPIGITVGGTRIIRPGVYPRIDASAMVPLAGAPYNTAGVIGSSDGGVPGQVYNFTSFTDALAVLRSGSILSYLARIFRPSPDLAGASLVRFVRIGSPVQSTLTAAGMSLTARDYGRHTQGISVQVEAGTSIPWKVTVRKRLDGSTRSYSVGNAVEVYATGVTAPKVVFDHVALQVKQYENAVVVGTMDYPTENVTLVNLISFLTARVGWAARIKVGGDPSMPVKFMDCPILADAPALSVVTGTYAALPASQGMLAWMLRDRDPIVTGDATAAPLYTSLAVLAETYLAGGTGTANDVFVASDWAAGLAKMESEDVQCLFAGTTDTTVQAACHNHCISMRTILLKRWRRFYTGGGPNQSVASAIAGVPGFDGPTVYVWNGTTQSNPITGLPENLGGIGSAAQLMGMRCGNAPCISLTNKALMALGLENPNPSDSDVTQMLVAGVTPIGIDPSLGRVVCVQAITAWQGGTNVTYRKEQGLTVNDNLLAGFQMVLNKFTGQPMDRMTGRLIFNQVGAFLDSIVRTGTNPDGYLTQGQANGAATPAWNNLQVNGDGLETWSIFVECHPVGETAYITVLCFLTPATISL